MISAAEIFGSVRGVSSLRQVKGCPTMGSTQHIGR
jgi:hypothetical protein